MSHATASHPEAGGVAAHQRLTRSSFSPHVACLCMQSSHGLKRTATAPGWVLPHFAHQRGRRSGSMP